MGSRKISELDELHELKSDASLIASSDGALKLVPLHTIIDQLVDFYEANRPGPAMSCEWTPAVQKAIVGWYSMRGGEFTFQLERDGAPVDAATNAADGTVTFKPIKFYRQDAGVYIYTIREVPGADDFVHDDHVLTCNLRVYVDAGELKTSVIYTGDTTFTNRFTGGDIGTVTWTPNIQVALYGASLSASQFSFDLADSSGSVLQTAENNDDGSVTFEEIEFSAANIGTHIYTVKERGGSDGIIYDGHTVTYTLTVYNNDGKLDIAENVNGSELFSNYYKGELTPATWTTKVYVEISGRPLAANEFQFYARYKDQRGIYYNNATGIITISQTFYETDVGTQYITVTQDDGKLPGVEYDLHEVQYTIEVSASGSSVTARTASTSGDTTFRNTYTATITPIYWAPKITKLLSGESLKADQFSFKLEKILTNRREEIQTVKNKADGSVPFAEIPFTENEIGENKFVVTEVGGAEGYTTDTHECQYTITISKLGTSMLQAKETVSGATIFTNEKAEALTVDWKPPYISKVLHGRDAKQGEFEFVLAHYEGAEVQRKTNNAASADALTTISFDPVTLTEGDIGRNHFVVSETKGSDSDITYDEHVVDFYATVSGDGGSLTVKSETVGSPKFDNTYTATIENVKWKPSCSVELIGGEMYAGQFNFEWVQNDTSVLYTRGNDLSGDIPFPEYVFDSQWLNRTLNFSVRQKEGVDENIVYDKTVMRWQIQIYLSGTSLQVRTISSPSDTVFHNSVSALSNTWADVKKQTWQTIKTKKWQDLQQGEG